MLSACHSLRVRVPVLFVFLARKTYRYSQRIRSLAQGTLLQYHLLYHLNRLESPTRYDQRSGAITQYMKTIALHHQATAHLRGIHWSFVLVAILSKNMGRDVRLEFLAGLRCHRFGDATVTTQPLAGQKGAFQQPNPLPTDNPSAHSQYEWTHHRIKLPPGCRLAMTGAGLSRLLVLLYLGGHPKRGSATGVPMFPTATHCKNPSLYHFDCQAQAC